MAKRRRQQFPNRVRKLRLERRMFQRELARRAGLTPAHLCHIEQGDWMPRFDTQRRIVKALGLKVSDLPDVFPMVRQRRKAS